MMAKILYFYFFDVLNEQIDKATALQIKILFHWPKKSALVAMGQKIPKGITQAVAVKTLARFFKLSQKQVQIINHRKTVPRMNPIMPVSVRSWR